VLKSPSGFSGRDEADRPGVSPAEEPGVVETLIRQPWAEGGAHGARGGTALFDASVLARLVGLPGGLRPAITGGSQRIIRAVEDSVDTLDVTVVGEEGGIIHVECADPRILALDRRAVVIAIRPGEDLLRLEGSLELVRPIEPFRAALHLVAMPDVLQRRKWARAPTNVVVRLTVTEDSADDPLWHETRTVDLSPGGVCLTTIDVLQVGQHIRMHLQLAGGLVDVRGEVLALTGAGTARVRFVDAPESEMERHVRHHLDVEAAQQYPFTTY